VLRSSKCGYCLVRHRRVIHACLEAHRWREVLSDLASNEGKPIIMVEQNVKLGL